MKHLLLLIVMVISTSSFVFGQDKKSSKNDNNSVETQLIALEKQAAQEWWNKNVNFYKSHLSDDAIGITPTGTIGKSEIINLMSSMDCKMTSYSMDSFKVTMLDKDAAILTYHGTGDVTCGGQKEPPASWASTVYVKRGGKWVAAFHQETLAPK